MSVLAPSVESKPLGPIGVHDIRSLGIAFSSGRYLITGKKVDGGSVSWRGTNRANAIIAMDKLMGRLV